MNVLILGAGAQGRVVAEALSRRGASVTLADIHPPPGGVELDVRDLPAVEDVARGRDVVVTTLPARIGTLALPALLAAGVPVVDVSFTVDLPFHLDAEARRRGVPVLVDLGVAPGLSHVLTAELVRELGRVDSIRILVGGIPIDPPHPFIHAVYFHAEDLIDEYLRPARLRRDGKEEAPDPLSEMARFVDEEAGELEAFPSDGLRSLLTSYPDVPTIEEMTLRAPGHLDVVRSLRGLGLLTPETAPATAAALEQRFPGREHPDRLLMEVHAGGGTGTRSFRVHVTSGDGSTAMARATAFTAAAGAILLAEGSVRPGVLPPESIGAEATKRLLEELATLGVRVERTSRLRPR